MNFPQLTLLKGEDVLFSFMGYNREKANEAIAILTEALGLGRPQKQLSLKARRCPQGHDMQLVTTVKQQQYIRGCYECDSCHMLAHF